jgi:hypothetical protein
LIVSVPIVKNAREEDEFQDHHIDVFLIAKVTTPILRKGGSRPRKAS